MKKRPFLACGLFLGISLIFSLVAGIPKQDSFSNNEVSATAQTGVDYRIVGDGIETTPSDYKWDYDHGVPMKEIKTGIYSGTVFATQGQICVTPDNTFVGAFGYNDLDDVSLLSGYIDNALDHQCANPNIYALGHWCYFRLTLDTSKSDHQLSIEKIFEGNPPTIAGTGVTKNTEWNCSSRDYVFDTADGVTFTKMVTTTGSNSFRIVGLETWWSTYSNFENFNSGSPSFGLFASEGNDKNFQTTTKGTFVIKFNYSTHDTWIYGTNQYNFVYYVGEDKLISHDVGIHNTTYSAITHYSSNERIRFYGYYTDESLTTKYVSSTLLSDLFLYGDYREYSQIIYFASGPDWGWANGANVYAWDSDNHDVGAGWPGSSMTWLGAGLYSFEYCGEQRPTGFKFSETGNPGNQTGDVEYTNGTNLYIYESNSCHLLTDSMIKAELFSETFITDVGSTGAVSSATWATSKDHASDVLADEETLAIIQSGSGVFAEAGLSDWVDIATTRYDEVGTENEYEDYLERGIHSPRITMSPSDIESHMYVGGRHTTTNDYITMDWGLSSLEFNISGGGSIYLNGNLLSNSNDTKFAVVIDGGNPTFRTLAQGNNRIQIAKNLSSSTHKVEVYKTSQAENNLFNLASIEVYENAVISKVASKSLNIEVVGDSLAAGETYIDGSLKQNAYHGFARHLKDAYNANVNLVARNGIGLIAGYNNGSASTSNQMNSIYDYTNFYRDETASLDATQFVPDIIVVSLGNNDLGSWIMSRLGHTISDFKTAVASFNSKLHTYYPNAKIIWAYGGFINRGYLSEFRTAVEADSYASFVYLPKFGGSNPNVDDHPSITEYKEMADFISTEIARLLNEGVEVQDRIQNPLKQRMMFEAEECDVSGGNPNYSDGANWSNGKAVAGLPSDGYYEFNVTLTRTSTYILRVGGTAGNDHSDWAVTYPNGNIPYSVDGELVDDSTIFTTVSTWYPSAVCKDYTDIENVVLTKGSHTIKIGGTTNGGWINHDFIEIIEVKQLDCETFYQYFMNQTRTECTSSASSHSFDYDLWSTLADEYAELDDDNKDYVCDVYGDLVERYTLIMNTYHFNDFLIKSDGTHVYNARTFFGNVSSNMPILIVGSFIGITIVGSFFLLRKRDDNYQL